MDLETAQRPTRPLLFPENLYIGLTKQIDKTIIRRIHISGNKNFITAFSQHGIIKLCINIFRRSGLTIFSVLVALGAVLGLIWIALETPKSDQSTFLNAGFWVLMGALVGGRIAYVAVHWEYFRKHVLEIPQVWLGGLAWPGAVIGGGLVIVLVAWIVGIPLGSLVDGMLPLLASLSVAVWLGCMFIGCAYGPEVDYWWGLSIRDQWGIWKQRLPLQLIAIILTVTLFWGIERLRHSKRGLIPGMAACLGVGGISLILLGGSILRVDPYPQYNGLRLETWAALLILGLVILSRGITTLKSQR
jgi:prolipoprotein diacylglyceryltransferase